MRPTQVDAVIRVYDLADLPSVKSCILTLLGQVRPTSTGVLAEALVIHLMLQRFTFRDTQDLRSAVSDLLQLDERVGLTLHNWDYQDPFDLRVPLLNMALEVTSGRYLIFLDSADLLCPGALTTLLARLRSTAAAAAVGGVGYQSVRWWEDAFLPLNNVLQQNNECAAMFVLLDREKLPYGNCFKVSTSGSEITEFVNHLRQQSSVSEECADVILCVRQVYR